MGSVPGSCRLGQLSGRPGRGFLGYRNELTWKEEGYEEPWRYVLIGGPCPKCLLCAAILRHSRNTVEIWQ